MSQNKELAGIIKQTKYLQAGETFKEAVDRIAGATCENNHHFRNLQDILYNERFLPGGRIQASVGATRATTPLNCYVSQTIPDSMEGITDTLGKALATLRLGGGIGYDFSTLRPSGDRISSLGSHSSGPVGNSEPGNTGFMDLFDSGCSVIRSAGHRRGAQMGVLRVDHPDIRHFIRAKRTPGRLTNFNVSVGITDAFMTAVEMDDTFPLVFEDKVYEVISARNLWEEIMRSTWDYAEPGVLFIDRINEMNNLWYCETIAATNPCGEQPLPPHGACLLGSFNVTKYVNGNVFNEELLRHDIVNVVSMMDNVLDTAIYPLEEQKIEALTKRRMGLGVTGLAHASEEMGFPYGSDSMLEFTEHVLTTIRDTAYMASVEIASRKGPFKLFDRDKYLESKFVETLPEYIKDAIYKFGIRNSHLTSIAPTGTISLSAGNISSGIEPPYTTGVYSRKVYMADGSVGEFLLEDYLTEKTGIVPLGADDIDVGDHVRVLNLASSLVDSAVSKTCNVGDDVTYDEFKNVYWEAYAGGAKGCTTFRAAGFREGIFEKKEDNEFAEGSACYIDPDTGQKTCE